MRFAAIEQRAKVPHSSSFLRRVRKKTLPASLPVRAFRGPSEHAPASKNPGGAAEFLPSAAKQTHAIVPFKKFCSLRLARLLGPA